MRILAALVCASVLIAAPQKKKNKEEQTQTLQLPKELPGAVTGSTRRLTFHVTPLTPKGLLSPQIREALKALSRQCGNETVLKIRAFVAGSGDVRRVRDLVSEYFSDRKQPLPSLTLVRGGGLPMEGAQVVLEAIASSKKDVNPHGLTFIAAKPETSDNPLDPVAPLAAKSLAVMRKTIDAAGAQPEDVVRVTCFLSSLENLAPTRSIVESNYPRAAADFVQTQRAPSRALAACEATARLASDPPEPVRLLDDAALVNAPEVVLTGAQASFGFQEQDAKLAFERLEKELQQEKSSAKQVVFAHFYPLSQSLAEQVRRLEAGFFDATRRPPESLIVFEGLPSMDAGFAVDVVAVR